MAGLPFTITGISVNGAETATRKQASSAIVVAMKWAERGVKNVCIAALGEEAQPFRTFQATHYPASRRV